jgi:alpha-beta hydrolase superfamily lysophospholipase
VSEGFFVGHGGWPVFHRWVVPQVVRARVLVVHGYSEHSGRYLHVLDALRQAGFAAVAADHRGHGRTARVRGDLEDRERVLTDLGVAHRRLLELGSGPVFLLAHSFGGAIGLRYLERHGDAFRGAVLNGVGLKVPSSIPTAVRVAAKLVARVAPTLPMQPFFDAKRNTRDPEAQQELIDDPIGYRGRIRARTGVEVMALIEEVRRDLDRVRVPLLLTHGSADLHVPAAVSEEVLRAVGSTDKTLVEWPGLLHETWREPEKDRVIAGWVDWIAARLG